MTNEDQLRVLEFFESYRASFEALDASRITGHFTFPLHITSDAEEISLTVIESRDVWMEQVDQLLEMYREIKFSSARILELKETELTQRSFQAVVHWDLHDYEGEHLYDFHTMYTLVMIQFRLHITAIAHDEIPRYQACLSRLKRKPR